jgi:hypothetical protein
MSKERFKFIITIVCSLLIICFTTNYAFACSCEPVSVKKRVKIMKKEADAIFTGNVKEVFTENPEFGGTIINKVVLTVVKSWRTSEIKEYTIYMNGGCRVWFEKGKTYIVYAKNDKENKLTTNMCMGTGDITLSAKDLKFLGKPAWANTN